MQTGRQITTPWGIMLKPVKFTTFWPICHERTAEGHARESAGELKDFWRLTEVSEHKAGVVRFTEVSEQPLLSGGERVPSFGAWGL